MTLRTPITSARPATGRAAAAPNTVLALVLASALALAGCETAPTGTAAAPATTAVAGGSAATAHARLIEAYNTCNEAAFIGAYAPLFSFSTSNTRQALTTREGLQRYLAAGCASRPNPTAALVQQSTRVSGAITVFAGQYRFKVPLGAQAAPVGQAAPAAQAPQTADVLQNFTLVMERMGERWLVLAHHVSVAP